MLHVSFSFLKMLFDKIDIKYWFVIIEILLSQASCYALGTVTYVKIPKY